MKIEHSGRGRSKTVRVCVRWPWWLVLGVYFRTRLPLPFVYVSPDGGAFSPRVRGIGIPRELRGYREWAASEGEARPHE